LRPKSTSFIRNRMQSISRIPVPQSRQSIRWTVPGATAANNRNTSSRVKTNGKRFGFLARSLPPTVTTQVKTGSERV
jgi:hypothetical protein